MTFTLPKLSFEERLQEYISGLIQEAPTGRELSPSSSSPSGRSKTSSRVPGKSRGGAEGAGPGAQEIPAPPGRYRHVRPGRFYLILPETKQKDAPLVLERMKDILRQPFPRAIFSGIS